MQITVDCKSLHTALRAANYERKSTLPIVACALVEAEGGVLTITCTDLEAFTVTRIAATITAPGRICADAGLLTAAAARDGQITLNCTPGKSPLPIAASSGRSRFRIPAMNADDFPSPAEEAWQPVALDADEMAMAFDVVNYSAGRADHRYYLNCLCIGPGVVNATDSHRVASMPINYTGKPMLVPTNQFAPLGRMMGSGAVFSMAVAANGKASMLRVDKNDETLIVKLIDGDFPDCSKILANYQPRGEATIDRDALLKTVARATPFAESLNKFKYGRLIVDADSARIEMGENAEHCGAVPVCGAPFEIGLNLGYLAQTLGALRCDNIELIASGSLSSVDDRLFIRPAAKDAKEQTHLISGAHK